MVNIAGIYYPYYEKLESDTNIAYSFILENKKLNINYEVYSDDYLLEVNYKKEIILRKKYNEIIIYKNIQQTDYRMIIFSDKEKVMNIKTLKNGYYLISLIKHEEHYLYLYDENLKMIKSQQIGRTSWHSQNSIDENKNIIMWSEYNVAKTSTKVSIWRSLDNGLHWEEVFFLNAPEEIRHWHTLQVDQYSINTWLATSGDTPEQSKWFLSKDNGDNWIEITDKDYINQSIKSKSLSAHRTTSIKIDTSHYYWATDDLMGSPKEYFIVDEEGKRKASSKFYRSVKKEPINIEFLSSLGIHIRSMIDIGKGYIFISEGKYVSYNSQVFYIDKSNLNKVYFLFNLKSLKGQGGTYSIDYVVAKQIFVIRHIFNKKLKTLQFSFSFNENINKVFAYNIQNYLHFEEHLWFINKINSIKEVLFFENSIRLTLAQQKEENTFYLLLGDAISNRLLSKELFEMKDNKYKLSLNCHINQVKCSLFIQQYDDDKKVSSKSYKLKNGKNSIVFTKDNNAKYLKLLIRIAHTEAEEIVLSNLSIKEIDNVNKTIQNVKKESIQATSIPSLDFKNETDILNKAFIYDEYTQYDFVLDNLQVDILTHFKKSDKLVVFYNGAVDVEKTPPPVFQRWSWLKNIPYSGMVIMDPTIYELMKTNKNSTYIGWYQGNKQVFILKQLVEIVENIAKKLNVSNDNIIFYGSSAGGFASLMSAGMLKGSKACVVNPQVNVLEYHKKNVDILLKHLNITRDKLGERKYTLDVVEYYKSINYFPEVYYKQNEQDTLHHENHFKYFADAYKQFHIEDKLNSIIMDDTRGHSAIPLFDEAYEDIKKTIKKFNTEKQLTIFGFVKNATEKYLFKPRKDLKEFKLHYPLDWNIDPFNDRNWCFHLHAWRMLDNSFIELNETNNTEALEFILETIEDWYNYIVVENRFAEYSWYDMAVGLRASKIAYLYEKLVLTDRLDTKYKAIIQNIAELHIDKLVEQKISNNNHGIFQLHGLILLTYFLKKQNILDEALLKMENLLKTQFYDDGFHTENSDEYHWFVLSKVKELLTFEAYSQSSIISNIIIKAEDVTKWTVFPDKTSLMIGDSSFTKRRVDFQSKEKKEFFYKFFASSGYCYIRSSFYKNAEESSLLYLQTAYKHNTHRHADDFNILLYEFGKNILVDAGKHSYEYHSKEREYVIATHAHNCVVVDDQNYPIDKKYFYDSVLKIIDEDNGVFYAKTSLYRDYWNLQQNRNIIYKPKEFLIVIDTLLSQDKHNYKQCWHFHQDLEIKQENGKYRTAIADDINLNMNAYCINLDTKKATQNLKLLKAQKEPYFQGWRSLKYRELTPNYALENEISAKNSVLITRFVFNEKDDFQMDIKMLSDNNIECSMKSKTFKINKELNI